MTAIIDPLKREEMVRLARLEKHIEAGLCEFVRAGLALREIRESRLYRGEFTTFESYCKLRWDLSAGHAHRLVAAADVLQSLPVGDFLPISEHQCRPLAPLKPEQRRAVWEEASAGDTRQPATSELLAIIAQGADAYDAQARRQPVDFAQEQLEQVNAAADQARRQVEELEGERELVSLSKAQAHYQRLHGLAERMELEAKRGRKNLVKFRRLSRRVLKLSGTILDEINMVLG